MLGFARLAVLLLLSFLLLARGARADDVDPDTEAARRHFKLGAAAYEKGDYSKALAEFELARRLKPLAAFDYNIARCLDRLERYAEAIEAYERFIAQVSDPFESNEARVRVAVLKSRVGDAPVPKANEQDAEANKMLDKGIAQFKAGKLTDARATFFQLRKMVPEKANPYRWLGMTYARLNQCAEAVTNLDAFLDRVPPEDARVVEAVTIRDRCKAELGPSIGTLSIESAPTGAEVVLDDELSRPLGLTPYRNPKAPAGEHTVYLRKKGFQTLVKKFSLGRKETVSLDVTLRPVEPAPAVVAPPVSPPPRVVEPKPAAPEVKASAPEVKTTAPEVKAAAGRSPGRTVAPATKPAGAPRTAPEMPPVAAAPPKQPSDGPRKISLVGPIVIGALTVALAGAGAGLVLSVRPEFDELQKTCGVDQTCDPSAWSGLQTRATVGYVLLGVAGAALVTEGVLWAVTLSRMKKSKANTAFWIAPSLMTPGVSAGGAF